MTNNDENIKNKIDKINSLHMDILNFNLNNQNQIYSDFLELKKEIFSKFEDIDNKMKFLYNRINELDNKINIINELDNKVNIINKLDDKIKFITNDFNHQKVSIDEIYNSINNNNENIQKFHTQINLLQTSLNEVKQKNNYYEVDVKQINNFDKITNEDKDIKINKKCLSFL
jgi:DNA repair ATPase RecN